MELIVLTVVLYLEKLTEWVRFSMIRTARMTLEKYFRMCSIMKKFDNEDKATGLGYVLKLLRIANDMTTRELSDATGLSQAYICEVESNNKTPSLDALAKYSSALGVSKSTILFFEEQENENKYEYQELLYKILEAMIKSKKNDA